tara:strand:+ start:14 stop:280 length:267 start_codon:yes stop_codon:yes gene_type:complete
MKEMTHFERAKEMTHHCVRNNTILEDIHAGKSLPDEYMEGYSRISQEEMKQLMQEIISNIETCLQTPILDMIFDSGVFKAPKDWTGIR